MSLVALPNIDHTARLASILGSFVAPGHVVELHGEVGAGKTTFTGLLARVLGVREPVRSPTYTIAHRYEIDGQHSLVHVDCYRCGAVIDASAWGDLEPFFDARTRACIEWPGAVRPWLADRPVWCVTLTAVGAGSRTVEVRGPDVSNHDAFVDALLRRWST